MKKLNELEKLELLGLIVGAALALLALIPYFVFNQIGWLVGVGIGTAIELLNIFLLYKGRERVLKEFKTSAFLLCYFGRLTLFIIGFALTGMLGFGLTVILEPIPAFINSIWGVLIAYTPMQIVIIVVMVKSKKGIISIAENNIKETSEE